jgi:hypothetical protein
MNEYLTIKWTVSRARDTYGYNVCTLTDTRGRKVRCDGGGYDMTGTALGDYLGAWHQGELLAIKDKAVSTYDRITGETVRNDSGLYGLTHVTIDGLTSYMGINGACGIESVFKIAKAAGIEIQANYQRSGRRRGKTLGFMLSPVEVAE